ncbi:MAG TPA: lipid-A-disaccharide synthase-related protein [Kamptonema sp.]|nr:lipid-A-disaccharide synthase-related protein [Kamptonema sp.]
MNARLKLLCLSNGHGEDAIAVRILRELQQQPHPPELAALPLVGEGQAYSQLQNIPIVGPVRQMPSGGFIYMDGREFIKDVNSGLLQLVQAQFKIVRAWARDGGSILAVGDIVPLLFAWLSGAPYAFVGTAKSEYYLRDEDGPLPRKSRMQRWEGWSGSVYLPWERWLMSRKRCKAVFPRDALTAETLQKFRIPAYNLGNPMVDDLEPENPESALYRGDSELREKERSLIITLLPGSRAPEAYANWQLIVAAIAGVAEAFRDRNLLFLGAIAPTLSLEALCPTLESYGWQRQGRNATKKQGSILQLPVANPQLPVSPPQLPITFTNRNVSLILTQQTFNDCLNQADFAIAMAGTATEQFVGLGKPAIAIPGTGPQFTPAFAEAQSRLLGPSVILVKHPPEVTNVIQSLLGDPDRLQLIAANGKRRMGEPGAARRISHCLMERLIVNS